MKKLICLLISLAVIVLVPIRSFAAEQGNVIYEEIIDLGNGITVVDRIVEYAQIRSTVKTAERSKTIRYDNAVVGVIKIRASFSYDGTNVEVSSKSVVQTDVYDGWGYKQNSFTSSGGTVTLDAKLTKLLVFNIPFTITMTCDKNGNIT